MTGDTHYDLEILAELAEGLLDAGTARQVREHLAVCDPCGELLADLAAVREVLAATPTPAMPMGVALRIDKALAAEAGSARGGGVGLAEPPNWDELMRDSPWERSPREPEPVRLGVVSDDGTIVPAKHTAARRRRWAMPAVAAAAAAAVVGTAVLSTSLLAGGGGGGTIASGHQLPTGEASSPPPKADVRARAYALTDSGHNYSEQELRQPLEGIFGPAPIAVGGSSDIDVVDKCVSRVSNRTKLKVFAVDQGQFNGSEAIIMTSWKNKAAKTLRVDIVDPFNCKSLRKPMVGRW
ncbi:anti-sigma factor family protein [Nonomuraea sp. NPDC050022]|uniref:anti-sigma factor family protein n=1 Tax=Nonomuraea sp. NPDC050022 TaxID=3364358 RepID=UPI0037B26170